MIKRVSEAFAKRGDGEKGFTLIELLVVVIIIGILAAVAIPVFLNMREGAWKASVESDVANAVLAVEQAASANNGSLQGVVGPTNQKDGYEIKKAAEVLAKGTASQGNTLTISIDNTTQVYTITGGNDNITTGDSAYVYTSNTGKAEWKAPTAGSGG